MNRWKKNRFARASRPVTINVNIEDVTNFISDYFYDLKKKLKYNRVVDRIDMELPRLIIRKFKELFEIWDNNLLLTKCLDKDLFEDVYYSMAYVFESLPSNTSDGSWSTCDSGYLECYECGEEIVLRNNNREYSVAYHNTSRQHLEFIDNFEKVRNERKDDFVKKECLKIDSKIPRISNDTAEGNSPLRKCLKCDECDEEVASKDNIDIKDALVLHKKSLVHWEIISNNGINEIDLMSQVINGQGITVVCHLCCVTISIEASYLNPKNDPVDIMNSHTNGENHILNLYWFSLQKSYITVHSKEDYMIKCTLCDETFTLDSFHSHFYAGSTSVHGRRMLLASINIDNLRKSVGRMKIYYMTRVNTNEGVFMKCHICHVLVRAITSDSNDEEFTNRYIDNAVNMHQETEEHILNLYWFELQSCYIRIHDIKENLIKCSLCDEIFRLDSFHKHFYTAGSNTQHERRVLLSSIHQSDLKNAISEMKIDFINQVQNKAGIFIRCHICRVLVPTITNSEKSSSKYLFDVVNLHQQDEDHLLNLYWLQLQKHYIEVYDRKQNMIRCTLCDIIFHLDSFYDHFYGGSFNQHNRRILLVAITDRLAKKSITNVQ